MRTTNMGSDDAVELYSLLVARGIHLWVDGGWGVDALLHEQTRPHKDLDILLRLEDLPAMIEALAPRGFTLKEMWTENRWIPFSASVGLVGRGSECLEVATAFVLHDPGGREIDAHVLTFDERGSGAPAWNTEFVYPPDAFCGRGSIAGVSVSCLSARTQMLTHTGYILQEKDLQDLKFLHERFAVAYPPGFAASLHNFKGS